MDAPACTPAEYGKMVLDTGYVAVSVRDIGLSWKRRLHDF